EGFGTVLICRESAGHEFRLVSGGKLGGGVIQLFDAFRIDSVCSAARIRIVHFAAMPWRIASRAPPYAAKDPLSARFRARQARRKTVIPRLGRAGGTLRRAWSERGPHPKHPDPRGPFRPRTHPPARLRAWLPGACARGRSGYAASSARLPR